MCRASAARVTPPASTTRTRIARSSAFTRGPPIRVCLWILTRNPYWTPSPTASIVERDNARGGAAMGEQRELRWSDAEAARIVRETYGAVIPEGDSAVAQSLYDPSELTGVPAPA